MYAACISRPISAAGVHDRLQRTVPVAAVAEMLTEFARLGLVTLDGSMALALALPAVPAR